MKLYLQCVTWFFVGDGVPQSWMRVSVVVFTESVPRS